MDAGPIVIAVLAAVIGSTGIAGFLTAGVQWTRSARLRRAIESHAKLVDTLGRKTPGGQGLAEANQMDALRLAAMSLLRPPQIVWAMTVIFVLTIVFFGVAFFFLGFAALDLSRGTVLQGAKGLNAAFFRLTIGYIIAAVVFADFAIRLRRERFVRAMIAAGKVTRKSIRQHDFLQNRTDDIRAKGFRDRAARSVERFAAREPRRRLPF